MKDTKTAWDLTLLYKNENDPQIEKDIQAIEKAYKAFGKKYRDSKSYLKGAKAMKSALEEYENLFGTLKLSSPITYFYYRTHLNSKDEVAQAMVNKLSERFAKLENDIVFFELSLGKIDKELQKKFLKDKSLSHFHYFLKLIFDKSKHDLSESEEKILGLKALPSYTMWVNGLEKSLNKKTVEHGGKQIPMSEALQKIADLKVEERRVLHKKCMDVLFSLSEFAEAEMNAVVTNKKINDELRGFKEPYSQTILSYQNNEKGVLNLISTVTKNFVISHRFFELKKKILGLPHLEYSDRNVGIGNNVKELPFSDALKTLQDILHGVSPEFGGILDSFISKGQIDVYPKEGKTGIQYCWGNVNGPTFVLLNYTNTFDSLGTFAHEMGHAIHTELSHSTQSPLYRNYSTSTAEVASTFFESLAFDVMFEKMSPEEKVIALHNKINDDIQTIFRQTACFNFELELHNTIREKGSLEREGIAKLMNKHMGSYLGRAVELKDIDGYFFVTWSHIRNFFYVYSYTFGQLVSKALYANYKKDKSYLKKIEVFLKAGSSMSPEAIFKSAGIDVLKPSFYEAGLATITEDIDRLEKLTKRKK